MEDLVETAKDREEELASISVVGVGLGSIWGRGVGGDDDAVEVVGAVGEGAADGVAAIAVHVVLSQGEGTLHSWVL